MMMRVPKTHITYTNTTEQTVRVVLHGNTEAEELEDDEWPADPEHGKTGLEGCFSVGIWRTSYRCGDGVAKDSSALESGYTKITQDRAAACTSCTAKALVRPLGTSLARQKEPGSSPAGCGHPAVCLKYLQTLSWMRID